MSKWIELLKLVPTGIMNADKIVEGVINDIKLERGTLPEDAISEIAKRRLICGTCPYSSTNAKELTGYTSERDDVHCSLCLCNIKKKTAALSGECGIATWNAKHPEEPMELKWTSYEKPKS